MAADTKVGKESESGDVLNLAAELAREYVREAATRRVGPSGAALAALSELNEPFPDAPSNPAEVISLLDRIGSATTMTTTGGRYFGFMNGGMVPTALAANWLAATWN